MKRILVLTAGYGEGHNAAARALGAALTEAGAEVQVRDLFLEAYGEKQETSRDLYLKCIERTPWAWAIFYSILDRLPVMRFGIAPFLGKMESLLASIVQEWTPHAVVSVYPGYGYVLDRIYPGGRAPFARHTLVTDSLTINSAWYRAGSDTWLVPNEDTADVLRVARVPAAKIHVTGFPVPLVFADQRPERPEPGDGIPLCVLYMINSNRQHASTLVRGLLAIPGLHLTVTAGKDPTLGQELEQVAKEIGKPVEIHGWTDRMPELLMSHHVLIGKAGGAATQEALAARTPMLITKIVPGQELGNAQLIERHHCGAVTKTPEAVINQIEALMRDNCVLWRQWHDAIQRLSRPQAARDTARFILGFDLGKSHP
jgi:processive 1,2-diacylglycerol beta-glucosyltransferase